MNILYITEWFDPEPTPKGLSFAKHLANLGHTVEVLTGFPNYPGGLIYQGYKQQLYRREQVDNISLIRVPLYPSHDRSPVRRILTYLSFALSAAVLGPFLVKPFDLVYVYSPPASVGFPAMVFKFIFRKPTIYDIQDLWPDTLRATGMVRFNWMLSIVGLWCKAVYKMASHITVLSPGFKKKLIERGVPPEKVTVVYNWADDTLLGGDSIPKLLHRASEMGTDTFNVLFAGTMGLAQGLDSVLEAAQLLLQRMPSVRIYLVGGGVEAENLKVKAARLGLSNVVLLPKRTLSEMIPLFKAAHVLLVHLKRDPLFDITIPSKTQAYLASGKPILMAVEGDAANLVERSAAGLVCRPEDPIDLVEKIERLAKLPKDELEKMGQRGRAFYEKELSMEVGINSLLAVFTDSFRTVAN